MPKLPPVTGRQAARALERAGFERVRTTGSHAQYVHSVTRRKATVPLTNKTLPAGTLGSILRQAGLSVDEFIELLD